MDFIIITRFVVVGVGIVIKISSIRQRKKRQAGCSH
jgi:hypothetical protein